MAELVPAPGVLLSESEVDETVVQLVLGLTDPASFNRAVRFPTDNTPQGKSAFFQAQFKSISGDNFSGLPVTVIVRQDLILENNFLLQLPISTPLSSLTIVRFRDMVRSFIIQDKNVTGGACPMVIFNRIGSTALRIDLLSGLSAVGEVEYGGAVFWPNAFQPTKNTLFGAATGGPWSRNPYINKVAPLGDPAVPITTWQGFAALRAAHGPALGNGYFRHNRYIRIDGSPWSRPGANSYLASVPTNARAGKGIYAYICQWQGAVNPATDLPTGSRTTGQWVTQPWLIANRINYDELFYLTAGCISICVCPQLPIGHASILPGGVYFLVKLYRYINGGEKPIFATPAGVTLNGMRPGDPYCVIPVYDPGEYRVEFIVWLDPASAALQGNYTYGIMTNSLTEFMGHHMAPGLVSNNLNTLVDGDIARVDYRAGSNQENIATFAPIARTSNANLAATSSSIKSAAVRANTLTIYDNTGNNNDGGSIVTAQMPTGTDWSEVLLPPRYADVLVVPPGAFQTPGLSSYMYADPGYNLQQLSKDAVELRMRGTYKSFHGLGGRKECELTRDIVACRVGQIRSGAPLVTLVSQFALDYPLDGHRATVTVIMASPNAVWFAAAASQPQALSGTSPIDFRVQIDMTGEYTTENMWRAASLQTSLTTWRQVETAATILAQLDIAVAGDDPAREFFRNLPAALRDRLDDYMKKGVAQLPFAIVKR